MVLVITVIKQEKNGRQFETDIKVLQHQVYLFQNLQFSKEESRGRYYSNDRPVRNFVIFNRNLLKSI